MAGIESIVQQILQEAEENAKEIKARAEKEAEQIVNSANLEAEKIKSQSDDKLAAVKAAGTARTKSSADLKKRQATLKAKQDIINNVFDKAYERILSLPEDRYFDMIIKCLEKSVQPETGYIIFSDRDRARLTEDIIKKVEKTAVVKGGQLTVSDEHRDVEAGFVLVYGGIEENCSFKSMMAANREQLADKVNHLLFVDNK
jgi:V/A-type H+-transporting ATPase subunit E